MTLTHEAFDHLLDFLGPDRATAGKAYEDIRGRLVRLFQWRGSRDPEELADETINRVAVKIASGVEIRSDDPFRYFCGVAHLVFKEILRRQKRDREVMEDIRHEPPPPDPEDDDPRLASLRSCLEKLGPDHHRLILEYHRGEKGERIRRRRRIAEDLGIPINALRIRVHRLRQRVERCVKKTSAAS